MEYYKKNETFDFGNYLNIPIILFQSKIYKDKLSLEAKILYSFMLERYISKEMNYNNFKDKSISFTRAEAMQILNISYKTVNKVFKELKETGLIVEEKIGLDKSNKIFIKEV